MLIAAVMGHMAGWILEYGDHPAVLGHYAHFIGVPFATFRDNLIGSHSHEMAVASMALVLAAAVYRFGYREATGLTRALSRTGMALTAVGIVAMTAVYVAMAATSWVVPTLFQSANGTNGVAGDDILTGVLVMGGGLLALAHRPGVRWHRPCKPRDEVHAPDSGRRVRLVSKVASFAWVRGRPRRPIRHSPPRSRTVVNPGERWPTLLESVLGATPQEFESPILRHL